MWIHNYTSSRIVDQLFIKDNPNLQLQFTSVSNIHLLQYSTWITNKSLNTLSTSKLPSEFEEQIERVTDRN